MIFLLILQFGEVIIVLSTAETCLITPHASVLVSVD
jgi:hypothetical protein